MPQHDCIVAITLKCNSPKFTIHKKIRQYLSYKLDSSALLSEPEILGVNGKSVSVTILYLEFWVDTCTCFFSSSELLQNWRSLLDERWNVFDNFLKSSSLPNTNGLPWPGWLRTSTDYRRRSDGLLHTVPDCFLNPPSDRSRWIADHYLLCVCVWHSHLLTSVCACAPVSTCKQSEPFAPAQ